VRAQSSRTARSRPRAWHSLANRSLRSPIAASARDGFKSVFSRNSANFGGSVFIVFRRPDDLCASFVNIYAQSQFESLLAGKNSSHPASRLVYAAPDRADRTFTNLGSFLQRKASGPTSIRASRSLAGRDLSASRNWGSCRADHSGAESARPLVNLEAFFRHSAPGHGCRR
jgi:hypothetical protein